MQGKPLNVILFDDNEPAISRNNTPNRTLDDLFANLNEISRKVLRLEAQEQTFLEKIKVLLNKPQNDKQSHGKGLADVISFLEIKLQTLIRQTEQAIEQIKDEVERLLTKEILDRKMKKYQNNQDLVKIQNTYQQQLKLAQEAFDRQLIQISNKNRSIQQGFQSKLQAIEQRFAIRLRQMTANQYRLNDKIKQQQQQIRSLSETIKNSAQQTFAHQVQQKLVRPQLAEVKTVQNPNPSKQNVIDEDKEAHSRIRRNRIFKDRNTRVQPNQQNSVSPIKTVYSELASVKILRKDLDRFEDFKQHDLDGSDQDVFFYPESQKNKDSGPVLATLEVPVVSSFKGPIFSPFDVN